MSRTVDLMCLHGWGLNRAVWQRGPGEDAGHYPDLPGHGHDGRVPEPVLDAWVEAVLDTAPPAAVWLGWSFGGLLALAAARRHPERVRGLILVATTPRFVATPGWEGVDLSVWDAFAQALTQEYASTLQRFLVLQAGFADRAAVRALQQAVVLHGAPRPEALRSALAVMAATDLREQLAARGLPVLLIHGGRDRIVPRAAMEWLQKALAARTAWFENAGHAPFLSESAAFWALVNTFTQAQLCR